MSLNPYDALPENRAQRRSREQAKRRAERAQRRSRVRIEKALNRFPKEAVA